MERLLGLRLPVVLFVVFRLCAKHIWQRHIRGGGQMTRTDLKTHSSVNCMCLYSFIVCFCASIIICDPGYCTLTCVDRCHHLFTTPVYLLSYARLGIMLSRRTRWRPRILFSVCTGFLSVHIKHFFSPCLHARFAYKRSLARFRNSIST